MPGVVPHPYAIVVSPVVPHPPVAGGHKRILRLMEAIERAGARPHLLTEDDANPAGAAALGERGWAVDVLPAARQSLRERASQHVARRPSPYLREVAGRLAELAPRAGFVQFEHTQSAYYFGAAAGTRSVLSAHNVDSQMLATVARSQRAGSPAWARSWNRSLAAASVERRAARLADAVVCVSDEDAASFRGRAREVVVAPNGVDPELLAVPDTPPGGERVLFFGHLGYAPNVIGVERFLADGWPAVAGARPEARLRIVGPAAPASLSRRADASAGVEVAGFVDDIAAELADASAVIVPIWQGGGTRLKVLEAMAAARPIVGTPLGVEGIGFRDGEHGLLGHDPAALAAALVRVLSEPELARALGRAGRELARGYVWDRAAAPAEALYRRLLAAPAAP